MDFEFNPKIWFICKLCKKSFPDTDQLKVHKLKSHLGDCINIKSIIFEEKFLSYEYTPDDHQTEKSDNESPSLCNPHVSIPRLPLTMEHLDLGVILVVNKNKHPSPKEAIHRSYQQKQLPQKEMTRSSISSGKEKYNPSPVDRPGPKRFKRCDRFPDSRPLNRNQIEIKRQTQIQAESFQPAIGIGGDVEQFCENLFSESEIDAVGCPLPSPPPVADLADASTKKAGATVTVRKTGSSKTANIVTASATVSSFESDPSKSKETPRSSSKEEKIMRSKINENPADPLLNLKPLPRGLHYIRIRKNGKTFLCLAKKKEPLPKRKLEDGSSNKDNQPHKSSANPPLYPSFPTWLQSLKDAKLKSLNENPVPPECVLPQNVILLDPDPTSDDFDPELIDAEHPITCLLCSTKLVTPAALQLHADNCWFHNRTFHRFCVPCQLPCGSQFHLRQHQIFAHWDGREKLEVDDFSDMDSDSNTYGDLGLDLDLGITQSDPMTLGQWIQNLLSKINGDSPFPKIIIALDPDPTAQNYETDFAHQNSSSSFFNPIQCKLCERNLTSESQVKKHVQKCWTCNKEHHRYCIFCNKSFSGPWLLRMHTEKFHQEGPNYPFHCPYCYTGFLEELDWKRHMVSRSIFKPKTKKPLTSQVEIGPALDTETKNNITLLPNQKRSRKQIFNSPENFSVAQIGTKNENSCKKIPFVQWIQKERENNPANVILIEPDPTKISKSTQTTSSTDAENSFVISDANPVKCKLCRASFTVEKLVKSHVLQCWLHNKKRHIYCVPCEKSFSFNYGLRSHNSRLHVTRPTFQCKFCPKTFLDLRGVIRHEGTHETGDETQQQQQQQQLLENQQNRGKSYKSKVFKCPQPGCTWRKVDAERTRYLVHQINKHGKRTEHRCRECGRYFLYKSFLNTHERTHISSSGKPDSAEFYFKCSFQNCGRSFKSKPTLRIHENSVHWRELGLPEIPCPQCGKVFGTGMLLKQHLRFSHEPRPFSCPEEGCGKSFVYESDFLDHKREHTGETSCVCDKCGKAFTKTGLFKYHVRHGCGTRTRRTFKKP